MRVEDLVGFLKMFKLEEYLPGTTINGKEPNLDRVLLLVVRTDAGTSNISLRICMSLKAKEFTDLRKKALIQRKDRVLKGSNSEISTIPEIAALKSSSMVNGKIYFALTFVV